MKDLARSTGYSTHTLKYYLKEGLFKEASRSPETGYRYFNEETVRVLHEIRQMRKKGTSIRQIKNELL